MVRLLTPLFMLVFAGNLAAQVSRNVTLFGQLNPEPIHYAGCWGWTSPAGGEYALIGAFTGTSVISIDDSSDIHQVDFIPGPNSNWREFTVLDDFAYVVSEGSGPGTGLQVIDLSTLPDSASLVTTYTQTFTKAHMVQRDIYSDSAYIYVMGPGSLGGVRILDVSDPVNPVQVGVYEPYYIHDAHPRGNRLYAAAIWNGTLDVVDISDKTNPVMIAQINYPNAFTHSSFTTEDGDFLFVTDETDGLPARIWDVSDTDSIVEVAQYTANTESLVHNPYIQGDLAFISHNTEGLRVVDVADPSVPVEVGHYDTYPGPSGGFHGLWSAYPYFPSGKIIGGNRADGLYVFRFNETRAGRIYGLVTDSLTGLPVSDVLVTLVETGRTATGDENGRYKIGEVPADSAGYTLSFSAPGYEAGFSDPIMLNGGDSLNLNVFLRPVSTAVFGSDFGRPSVFVLDQNYPNPFNPVTTIRYEVPRNSWISLTVFDVLGRSVRSLVRTVNVAGVHSVSWDGRDDLGRLVGSGVYIYRLVTPDITMSRKLLFLK